MYDITFLAYHESCARQHWDLLRLNCPRAVLVDGVDGLVAAHQEAARRCKTKFFWVVDGDCKVTVPKVFEFRWSRKEADVPRVAVWRAENSVNGLAYGYGGIKLLPRREVLAVDPSVTDFTTSISDYFHPMAEVVSETVIHGTPFEAWKAGFRECTKLASGIIRNADNYDNIERLQTWQTTALDVPNYQYTLQGARDGAAFGKLYASEPDQLALINDWGWLRAQFDNTYRVEV